MRVTPVSAYSQINTPTHGSIDPKPPEGSASSVFDVSRLWEGTGGGGTPGAKPKEAIGSSARPYQKINLKKNQLEKIVNLRISTGRERCRRLKNMYPVGLKPKSELNRQRKPAVSVEPCIACLDNLESRRDCQIGVF
jgi:hypothetical protein